EHQGRFIDNPGLAHLGPEVVSFTGSFSHTGKDRISSMLRSNVVDQLLDQHRLSYSGASEKTDLSAFRVRGQKINNLDPGFQYLHRRALIFKAWRFSVDHPMLGILRNRFFIINRFSQHVKETSQSLFAYRHLDPGACSRNFHSLIES